MAPWLSHWWPEIVKCAERGGHSAAEIIEKVNDGHAVGWPVSDGLLVLVRTEDEALVIWLCAGRNMKSWVPEAERGLSEFARSIGCRALRIEGRCGWRRVLPHWTQIGDDLELSL